MWLCRILNNAKSLPQRRCIHLGRSVNGAAYESDGKTTVTIMNNEPGTNVMVNSFSKNGFRLNNGMFIIGPVALFQKTALSWNIEGDNQIDENSLRLFVTLEPKLDLLVVGTGESDVSMEVKKRLLSFYCKYKLNIEVLPTDKAASTYNFLSAEGRYVAAALVPPVKIDRIE